MHRIRGPLLRWGIVLPAVATSVLFNVLLVPLTGGRAVFLPFFPVILAVGYTAGFGPGLLAALLSVLAVRGFWMEPRFELTPLAHATDETALVMFVLAGGLSVAFAAWARASMDEARATKERLNIALNAGRMAAWEWNVATGQVSFAEGAQAIFGSTWTHVDQGWPLAHPDDEAEVKARVDAALASGTHYSFMSRMHRADTGELRWIESHGYVHRDRRGRPWKVTGVTVDVTELRRIQDQLQRESARKDAFLAILAHELRNPMAPIRYAAALLRPDISPDALAKARDIIQRQAGVMSRLLDDLLDMSRITRNAIRLKRDTLDLRQVVGQTVEAVGTALTERRHHLTLHLPDSPVWVSGDVARLQQVLSNLLDNAIKYTEPGGQVSVHLRETETDAFLTVTDSGLGLDETMLSQVFELFSQLHRASGVDRGGLGIGLAVVKQLVELHGGEVSASSKGPGHGSSFELRLPLVEPPEVAALLDADAGQGTLHDGQQVLVVDDNVDAAETLSSLLRQQSLSVAVAHSGAQALRSFEALRPRAVLLDIGLPDMSGHEVAVAMKRIEPSVRIIAVSGWNQPEDRSRSAKAGIDLHLVKPVDPTQVSEVVAQALNTSATSSFASSSASSSVNPSAMASGSA